RHADEKIWHVVCAHPVLIQDECDEHLVSHCVLFKLLAQPLHRSPVPDLVCSPTCRMRTGKESPGRAPGASSGGIKPRGGNNSRPPDSIRKRETRNQGIP